MRTKTFIKFANYNINETYLIKLKNISKKYKRKKNSN